MRQAAVLLIVLSIAVVRLHAQPKSIATIDSLLTEMTSGDLFSGVVLIADSSTILLSKGYGYADRENKVRNTPATRYDISTGANIFTGTAITYLAQQGKLKFTDTIGKYVKGLPKGNIITIHQVLTHLDGFGDFDQVQNLTNDFSLYTEYNL